MYFRAFAGFFVFTLLLIAPQVSADYHGVKITTRVVPGDGDFFIEASTYNAYSPGNSLRALNLTVDQFPWRSFMFYSSNGSYYIVWQGELSSEFHEAFYSNGSWYLLLQYGRPLIRINGRPFVRAYPYNLTYNALTIYRIKNGCIEPAWAIPSPFFNENPDIPSIYQREPGEITGQARLKNGTLIFSPYSVPGILGKVPLKAFKKYLPIVNASAFTDSLIAAQPSNDTLVIFFPALYYLESNGSLYAGVFQPKLYHVKAALIGEGRFVPLFKSKKATGYVFVFHGNLFNGTGELKAIPTVTVDLDREEAFPEITSQLNLRDCCRKNSSSLSSTPTTAGTGPANNPGLILLGLVIGLIVGAVLGYKMVHK